jgi:hypothetical protein
MIDTEPAIPYDINNLKPILSEHFGFKSFRPGQEEAIKRTLNRLSTLLIIPTGWYPIFFIKFLFQVLENR